jgi:hypothetical protein
MGGAVTGSLRPDRNSGMRRVEHEPTLRNGSANGKRRALLRAKAESTFALHNLPAARGYLVGEKTRYQRRITFLSPFSTVK